MGNSSSRQRTLAKATCGRSFRIPARARSLTEEETEAAMHDWEGIGYWVWGVGTVVLGVAFAWAYITYRRQGFRELPE